MTTKSQLDRHLKTISHIAKANDAMGIQQSPDVVWNILLNVDIEIIFIENWFMPSSFQIIYMVDLLENITFLFVLDSVSTLRF